MINQSSRLPILLLSLHSHDCIRKRPRPASCGKLQSRTGNSPKGPQTGAEAVDFSDAGWLPVRLPHDWAINGPYEPQGDANTGKLPWRGEGWYRKSFTLPPADAGKRVYLDFDGVMAMPTVYVKRPERWWLGLWLRIVPCGRDRVGEARSAQRRGCPRGHAPAQLPVVSGRGHLSQGAAYRQRSGACRTLGDFRHFYTGSWHCRRHCPENIGSC